MTTFRTWLTHTLIALAATLGAGAAPAQDSVSSGEPGAVALTRL